jgi:hypothetical protein
MKEKSKQSESSIEKLQSDAAQSKEEVEEKGASEATSEEILEAFYSMNPSCIVSFCFASETPLSYDFSPSRLEDYKLSLRNEIEKTGTISKKTGEKEAFNEVVKSMLSGNRFFYSFGGFKIVNQDGDPVSGHTLLVYTASTISKDGVYSIGSSANYIEDEFLSETVMNKTVEFSPVNHEKAILDLNQIDGGIFGPFDKLIKFYNLWSETQAQLANLKFFNDPEAILKSQQGQEIFANYMKSFVKNPSVSKPRVKKLKKTNLTAVN